MQDLNVINRVNAERCSDQIATARAAGKHVLVYRAGLHVTDVRTFDTEQEVRDVTRNEELAIDVTRSYLPPTTPTHSLRRDQSEDRALLAFAPRGERTLADYIARISR